VSKDPCVSLDVQRIPSQVEHEDSYQVVLTLDLAQTSSAFLKEFGLEIKPVRCYVQYLDEVRILVISIDKKSQFESNEVFSSLFPNDQGS